MTPISFDRAADYYDATRGYPPGVNRRIAAALSGSLPHGASLLEIGVGTGRIALPLSRTGLKIYGIDISRKMMERMQVSRSGDGDIAGLVEGDAASLPFAAAALDAVLAVHVLHLLDDWRAAIHEARRVIKPGGVFALGDDHRSNDGIRQVIRRKFEEISAALGYRRVRSIAADFSDVFAEFKNLGARMEVIPGAKWKVTSSIHDTLEDLEQRRWSSTWLVPDEIYPQVMAQLREWVESQYGQADIHRSGQGRFDWQIFRFS